MRDEERREFKRTDKIALRDDLQEWLHGYYDAIVSGELSDELYEMFGDMADDFIEKVFEPYKRSLNEPPVENSAIAEGF